MAVLTQRARAVSLPLAASVAELLGRRCDLSQSWTWVGSIRGLDWIRCDDRDPVFFVSNHCSTVDAVSFKL